MFWYTTLVLSVAAERIAELAVSRRNARRALARGGVEAGRGHYPVMVALHSALLAGCLGEAWLAGRPFVPLLGWPMFAAVCAAQALRWWCITSLGRCWNTRVLVVPGLPLVSRSPYRFLDHPNYLAVAVEGAALPLVYGAWWTAAGFTAANGLLMVVRIRCEDRALSSAGRATVRPAGAAPSDGLTGDAPL
ncbi:isoprenylcysteine carboxyl methyltransferase family protein [Streptomyces sp. TP-A0874]|uniref:isoprenylcysteine carboxyl methyltransferase family protein n=1 Tax=Streptomyces sp. TP-A0874 TaxID=549819 RepID=UPI000853CE64|nr:isoprenylcysteine carboxylmethyltransferase family protein [Streptomyces sp. TP-A0874]